MGGLTRGGNVPGASVPIGYILSLEGADSILTPAHLERAYAQGGLRAVGPAHYGPGRYAQGTNASGDLGTAGRELLREMERLGIILDVTHLCDDSLRDALDHFNGPVWASHSNCRALVRAQPPVLRRSHPRADRPRRRHRRRIRCVDARTRVGYGAKPRRKHAGVTLDTVADHIDRICQIAGNARHWMIGSDLDGAFGREQCPADVETITDLRACPSTPRAGLPGRGHSADFPRKLSARAAPSLARLAPFRPSTTLDSSKTLPFAIFTPTGV